MNESLSVYLDFVRVVAAVAVLLTHVSLAGMAMGPVGQLGHDSVIVFFVLSGLVISYAADKKEKNVRTYMINRMARLYSVVLPALLLILAVQTLGPRLSPNPELPYVPGSPLIWFPAGLFFVNELWGFHVIPGPFWSLGFEVWYYVMFGCAYFLRGRLRIVLLLACVLIAGPKIMVLLPLWVLGVLVQRAKVPSSNVAGLLLFVVSVVCYLIYRWAAVSVSLSGFVNSTLHLPSLGMAEYFASDYVVGLLVAANFLGFRMMQDWVHPLMMAVKRPVRFGSSFTFSLYLYQMPLLQVAVLMLPAKALLVFPSVLFSCAVLGTFTERQKALVREAITTFIDRIPGSSSDRSLDARPMGGAALEAQRPAVVQSSDSPPS